jgi:hypothetical protein
MVGLRDTQAFQSKLLEFQFKLIDANNAAIAAQDERVALLERVSALEKEVARSEAWEAEKQRYELKQVASGAVAYVPKEFMRDGEPPHWLCANCYQNHKKRYLQAHRSDHSFAYHECQDVAVKLELRSRHPRRADHSETAVRSLAPLAG